MTELTATPKLNALLNEQRDVLAGIALTTETLEAQKTRLHDIRLQLQGVQLGQAFASEIAAQAQPAPVPAPEPVASQPQFVAPVADPVEEAILEQSGPDVLMGSVRG